MVLIVDDQIGQVSRLLQMPAGVSEHCSVVRFCDGDQDFHVVNHGKPSFSSLCYRS